MKYKETEEPTSVEISVTSLEEGEKCPIKDEGDKLIKTYKKIVCDRMDLIDESLAIIRRTLNRLYECGEDNDSRDVGR